LQKYFSICIKKIGGAGFVIIAQIVIKLIAVKKLLFIFATIMQYITLFYYCKKSNIIIPIILGLGFKLAVCKLGVSVLFFILIFKSF